MFDPELDGYNGRLSVVLHQLGDALGKPSFTGEDIARLLGKPDAILKAGESRSGIVVPAGEIYLVYFWRGWHDYLYFVSRKGTIQKADWYYAYE